MGKTITAGANPALARAMQELRRSSATSKHRNRKRYYRPADKRVMA